MGHQPNSVTWETTGGQHIFVPNQLSDKQCEFLNSNIGISRRTLRHVHIMFNETFGTTLSWERFMALRGDAIKAGRCRTTYFRNYYKSESSSEKELRIQRPLLKARLTGGCQYQLDKTRGTCGAPTLGRYCEAHVHMAFDEKPTAKRGLSYVDSSLGKYG